MRLQRKLKKRIIKTFGRGTYVGIVNGFLTINKYTKAKGVIVDYTEKGANFYYEDKVFKPGTNWFHAHQYNPYLIFSKIY